MLDTVSRKIINTFFLLSEGVNRQAKVISAKKKKKKENLAVVGKSSLCMTPVSGHLCS